MKNAAATLKQKSQAPKRVAVELQERLDLTEASVDRSACIIRHVKICGKTSLNKHGMPGVTGTDYLPSFHAKAKDLYEGLAINVGHPPKTNPDAERDPRDRNGVLLNVQVINDETFGDWQLIPSHPMTPTFLDCAQNPKLHNQFALSHNAKAFGVVRDGRYQIAEPGLVRSVDAVTRGGVNRGLYESLETSTMQKTLIETLETAEPEVQAKFAPLLELMEDIGSMPMDAPAADKGYEGHCAEMVKAIVLGEGSAAEKLKKIKHALKILDDGEDKEAAAGEGKTTTESAETTTETPGATTVTTPELTAKDAADLAILRNERAARDVCESLEWFDATPIQIKAIAGLSTPADRKALAKTFKDAKVPVKKSAQAHTSSGRTLLESRNTPTRKTDKKAFAESILG